MFEPIVSDDHSYSSSMNGNSGIVPVTGTMSARSFRRPGQNTNNRNGTVFNDESDRSGSSSSLARAAIANASASSTSTVSTNNNNAGCGTASGKLPTNIGQSSVTGDNNIQELKKSLTLDFTNPENAKKALQRQTPFSFLRLTSPELEKLLAQGFTQGASVVQTPTPTQFFFPKNVTAEQEQYARGFLDALNHIYQRSGFVPVNNNILSPGFVANTVAQDAKDGTNKELPGPITTTSSTSLLPGPPTSGISLNAALVSNFLAAFSTPAIPSNPVPEPSLITTVSTSGQVAASASSSGIPAQNSTAFYTGNPGPVAFPTVVPSVVNPPVLPNSSSTVQAGVQFFTSKHQVLKPDPGDRDSQSVDTYDSRSSSVDSSSYPDQNSSYSDVDTTAAAALATMNRNGGQFANFGGAGFMQPSTQEQFLALTNAAQLLRSGEAQHLDHHLISTTSASNTPGSSSTVLTKMEICDDQILPHRFMAGTMPLDPVAQERLKLERKRARNRQAATKCRRRKIERITTLETEMDDLQTCNKNLETRRDLLMDELRELRNYIEAHQKAKCNINIPPHLTSNFTGNCTKSILCNR